MKNLCITLFFVCFVVALFLPATSNAGTADAILASDSSGTTEEPGAFVNNFYQFALGISGLLAFGAIVWGGIQYTASAGNPSGQTEGKEWIKGALWGLLLLAGAYLILSTINPDIINLELVTPVAGGSSATDNQRVGETVLFGSVGETDGRETLQNSDIVVNNPPCDGFEGCTKIAGVKNSVIDAVIQFKNSCNCEVVITGGTEPGHEQGAVSHGSGDKVDLRPNSQLNSYIENNYAFIGTRGDGAKLYRAPNGFIYAKEHNHWDVKGWDACFNTSGCQG